MAEGALPREIDFEADDEASPARMNRAMEFLFLLAKAAAARQPELAAAILEIQAVGLSRLADALRPVVLEANDIAGQLAAIRADWLASDALQDLLDTLQAGVTGQLQGVSTDVAAQLAANLVAVDDRLAALAPTAQWPEATPAEARAGTAVRLLSAAVYWAARQPVALVDAPVIALDLSAGINFAVTLGANRTLAFPTNVRAGQTGFIRVAQDGAGERALAFAGEYAFGQDAPPLLHRAPDAVTQLAYAVTAAGEVTITGGRVPRPGQTFAVTSGAPPAFYYADEAQEVAYAVRGAADGSVALHKSNAADPTIFVPVAANVGPGQNGSITLAASETLRATSSSANWQWVHIKRID